MRIENFRTECFCLRFATEEYRWAGCGQYEILYQLNHIILDAQEVSVPISWMFQKHLRLTACHMEYDCHQHN